MQCWFLVFILALQINQANVSTNRKGIIFSDQSLTGINLQNLVLLMPSSPSYILLIWYVFEHTTYLVCTNRHLTYTDYLLTTLTTHISSIHSNMSRLCNSIINFTRDCVRALRTINWRVDLCANLKSAMQKFGQTIV